MKLRELIGQLKDRLEKEMINVVTCVPVNAQLEGVARNAQISLLQYIEDLVIRNKVEELPQLQPEQKIFVIWKDWDGANIETFDTHEAAAKGLVPILENDANEINGTSLLAVIQGSSLDVAVANLITTVTLIPHKEENHGP